MAQALERCPWTTCREGDHPTTGGVDIVIHDDGWVTWRYRKPEPTIDQRKPK